MSSLAQLVEPYGALAESIVDFASEPDARHIGYLDLVYADRKDKRLPDGVVLLRNESIAYLVDAGTDKPCPKPEELSHLRRILAFRDDAPYMTVIEPGKLSVYGVALDGREPDDVLLDTIKSSEAGARTTFHRLQTRPDALFTWAPEGEQAIEQRLFDLMSQAVDELRDCDLQLNDAISLAGRALFTRFLLDRGIMKDTRRGKVCPGARSWEEVFSTAERVRATCAWLDRTFNGDFLPVSLLNSNPSKLETLLERGFDVLGNIMRRSHGRQTAFSRGVSKWGGFDFAHIPVGVLSQVYERLAEYWNSNHRHESSIYYTPRRIAEYMVKEAFALARDQNDGELHTARVLDPAAGGGVFLVTALRELAAEWWRVRGRPPNSKELRRILYEQIAGFDIEEPALRLTALSLYLTVIELDRNPTRMEHLRFEKPLRGRVLHMMREPKAATNAAVTGSLGPMVGAEHRGAYDMVIGNPPWTSSRYRKAAKRLHEEIRRTVTPIVEERLGPERARNVRLPDKLPDVPFVWRAMEWAKPDGAIALALHARLLFKGSQMGEGARIDLFDAMDVIGVLNGADVRFTEVWPKVLAPFCLLFARNRRPDECAAFYFISPYEEKILNNQGRLRIDAAAAQPISIARLRQWPELLKVLFRGNALDADILSRLEQRNLPTLKSWWERTLGLDTTARGYEVGGIARRRQDASFLLGSPHLTTKSQLDYIIDISQVHDRFEEPRLYLSKNPKIYKPPFVLVKQSPHADRNRARAYVCYEASNYSEDLAYNESFFGYSTHDHPEAETLVQYISLLIHSELFLWRALMTSGKFGVERDALLKTDIDTFPLIPMDELSTAEQRNIAGVFDAMATSHDRDAVDRWVYECYGLNRWDQEVIRDTLAMSLPANRMEAQAPPPEQEIADYLDRVQTELTPFIPGVRVELIEDEWAGMSPWCMFLVESRRTRRAEALSSARIGQFMKQADELGASQLVLADTQASRLLVGILRQRRYFTQTRARLCSLEILDEHSDALKAASGKQRAS